MTLFLLEQEGFGVVQTPCSVAGLSYLATDLFAKIFFPVQKGGALATADPGRIGHQFFTLPALQGDQASGLVCALLYPSQQHEAEVAKAK